MIADMATELEAARQLTYSTAIMKDANTLMRQQDALWQSTTLEMANRAAYNAVQIHGGYGYIKTIG